MANGGQAIKYPLQQAFCKAVLGFDVAPADPSRPSYRLQQILDPMFTYPIADEFESLKDQDALVEGEVPF